MYTFTPDCRCDKGNIKLIGKVFCPNTMCSGILCLHKKTLQSLGRGDYQCLQGESMCLVRKIPFKEQTTSYFFWSLAHWFMFLNKRENQFKMLLEMSFALECIVHEKSALMFIHGKRMMKTVTKILFRDQKLTIFLFGGDGTYCLWRRRVVTMKMKNFLLFWTNFTTSHNQPHSKLYHKRQKSFHFDIIVRRLPLVDTVNQKYSPFSFYTISVYSKTI